MRASTLSTRSSSRVHNGLRCWVGLVSMDIGVMYPDCTAGSDLAVSVEIRRRSGAGIVTATRQQRASDPPTADDGPPTPTSAATTCTTPTNVHEETGANKTDYCSHAEAAIRCDPVWAGSRMRRVIKRLADVSDHTHGAIRQNTQQQWCKRVRYTNPTAAAAAVRCEHLQKSKDVGPARHEEDRAQQGQHKSTQIT